MGRHCKALLILLLHFTVTSKLGARSQAHSAAPTCEFLWTTDPIRPSRPNAGFSKIRARLRKAGHRFHANDNIAKFLEPGEHEALLDEVAAQMKGVLDSLVIDTEQDHNTQDTARRVAKMYLNEVFRGRYVPAPPVTEFPNAASLNELMIVGPITVRSACSHHFCPIMGRLWIGIMPNQHSNLIGLSKYARLADWIMSRPQIQEEAITQIADLLMDKVSPTASPWSWKPTISACTGAASRTHVQDGQLASCAAHSCKNPSLAPRIPVAHQHERLRLAMLVRCSMSAARPSRSTTGVLDHSRAVARQQPEDRHHRPALLPRRYLRAGDRRRPRRGLRRSTTPSSATTATATSLLSFEEITERRFSNWTMGKVNIDKINPGMLLKYSEKPVFNPYASPGHATMSLMLELASSGAIASRGT